MAFRPRLPSNISPRLLTSLTARSMLSSRTLPAIASQNPKCRIHHISIAPFSTSCVSHDKYSVSEMSTQDYQVISEETMECLTDYLEEFIEDNSKDLADWEIEYSSGVLTLNTGETGTFVINKQPPNKQIWLSSPISGPKRFDYDKGQKIWFYTRDHTLLSDLLNKELSKLSQRDVKVDLSYS